MGLKINKVQFRNLIAQETVVVTTRVYPGPLFHDLVIQAEYALRIPALEAEIARLEERPEYSHEMTERYEALEQRHQRLLELVEPLVVTAAWSSHDAVWVPVRGEELFTLAEFVREEPK